MKDVASQPIEAMNDATSSLGKGITKSLKNCSEEASQLKESMEDFFKMDGFLKVFNKVRLSEKDNTRKSSIVHKPIDWSNYHPSAYIKGSRTREVIENYYI